MCYIPLFFITIPIKTIFSFFITIPTKSLCIIRLYKHTHISDLHLSRNFISLFLGFSISTHYSNIIQLNL
ncbi:hypothetical protein HanPSC8_Chr13g0558571 [Helianthus annuus]|nr:hypothetical protein HanPSC8_Chr13g0558571 [Helianthus annuus]